jgi:hypothetical protein
MLYVVRFAAALVFGSAVLYGMSVTPSPSPSGPPRRAPEPTLPARPSDRCPSVCAMIYQPVRCLFDNGASMPFGNTCQAESYACDHRLRIVGCMPRSTTEAVGPAV